MHHISFAFFFSVVGAQNSSAANPNMQASAYYLLALAELLMHMHSDYFQATDTEKSESKCSRFSIQSSSWACAMEKSLMPESLRS